MVSLDLRRPARRRARVGYRRALVPLTEGPEGELAVDLACRFADESHASVIALVPIEIELELPLDVPARADESRAHALLERALAIGATYGVRISPHAVRTRSAAEAILEEAVRGRAEIIVLGVPRDERLGSTVEYVLKHATCRVMLASMPPG
jgi:nucleotide-binding universal stress UspA family protein